MKKFVECFTRYVWIVTLAAALVLLLIAVGLLFCPETLGVVLSCCVAAVNMALVLWLVVALFRESK